MGTTAEELKIDYAQMETAMETIKNVMDEFLLASSDVFTSELAEFEYMNSDFVEKYIRIIESLRDYHIGNLSDNLNILYENAETILQELKETDKSYEQH